MAELTSTDDTSASSCCEPEAQATCCEPGAKAVCCGPSHGEGCACAVREHDAPVALSAATYGGGRIRTCEGRANAFTARPL
jgi:hypothetical protein